MTSDEMEIIQFMKQNPVAVYNRKEISRKAKSRSDYEENPHWASAPLNSLVALKYVIQNDSGHYRLADNFDRM
ncbi:MAG: hypothetical protein JWR19_3230 [Pedosphaera sp.]|nr:hypothetical protein [Pedosphaera sp.]